VVGNAGQTTRETRGRASCQMAEQEWERDPTASVASEQSTIGHCNDGDQTQRPGHHQEPPEYAREIPPTHGGAEKDGTGVSGPGPSARQGTTHGRTFRPLHRLAVLLCILLTVVFLARQHVALRKLPFVAKLVHSLLVVAERVGSRSSLATLFRFRTDGRNCAL
jgi:hypothetical protein